MEAAAVVVVAKGKRSKRQRVHAAAAPEVVTPAADDAAESSSLSSVVVAASGSGADEEEAASGCVTEEEEDMAMCLMLLARGGHGGSTSSAAMEGKKFRSRRREESGEFGYECKTCSKCFPSFQALGGHRTSHKKPRLPTPKAASEDQKKAPYMSPPPPPSPTDPTVLAIPATATPPPLQAINPNPKLQRRDTTSAATAMAIGGSRVHECSICGAEFASGQALGGHMRRHRPLVPAAAASEEGPTVRKEKSLLELDLNMPPAPCPCDDANVDDTTTPAFVFNVKDLLFPALAPAPAMVVDCHY